MTKKELAKLVKGLEADKSVSINHENYVSVVIDTNEMGEYIWTIETNDKSNKWIYPTVDACEKWYTTIGTAKRRLALELGCFREYKAIA